MSDFPTDFARRIEQLRSAYNAAIDSSAMAQSH
jgi:hypothetical protein